METFHPLLQLLRRYLRWSVTVLEASKSQDNAPFHRIVWQGLKGCTHRATKALRWLLMSRYRCIERVCCSVGTLLQ